MRATTTLLLANILLAGCGDNLSHPDLERQAARQKAGELRCFPNLDGRIEARELPVELGVPAPFLVSAAGVEPTVDVAGALDSRGRLVWDFGAPRADELELEITAEPLESRWYAPHFSGGELVLPLDREGRLEAIYRADETGLWILGSASREEAPQEGRTLLPYDEAVRVYRYPIEVGQSYVSEAEVSSGQVFGLPYVGGDRYEVVVDNVGELTLEDVVLTQALRVRTLVAVTPALGGGRTQRTVSFFFECLGEVARVTSRQDETAPDFTVAAEVRRLDFRR